MCNLRTKNPQTLLNLARDLCIDAELFDADSLFRGKYVKRDVENFKSRSQTCANLCLSIVEEEYTQAALKAAERLLEVMENLQALYELMETARSKPNMLLKMSANDNKVRLFEQLPEALASQLCSSIASGAIMQVSGATPHAIVGTLLEFLCLEPLTGKLCLGHFAKKAAAEDGAAAKEVGAIGCKVQETSMINLLDRMFAAMTPGEFTSAMEHIVKLKSCPVTPQKHAFSAPDMQIRSARGWQEQPILDLSLAVVMMLVLRSNGKSDAAARQVQLADAVHLLCSEKQKISLRLRIFRGARGREKNVGKHAWSMIEDMLKEGGSREMILGDVLQQWRDTVAPWGVIEATEGESAVEAFINWEGENRWKKIAEFAVKLASVRGTQDSEIRTAVEHVEKLLLGVQAAVEHLGAQDDFVQFMDNFLAGEAPPHSEENAEAIEDLQGNIELVDLFTTMVSTADSLSKSLDARRNNDAIQTELFERVGLFKKAVHVQYARIDGVVVDSLETLKSWSTIYREHNEQQIVETVLTSQPVSMKLLDALRKTGYDVLVGMFIQEHLSVSALPKTLKDQPHLLPVALQKLEVLPAAHRDVILRGSSYDKLLTLHEKIMARKSVGLSDFAQTMAQHVAKLRDETSANTPSLVTDVDAAWETALASFLQSSHCDDFEALHKKLELVVIGSANGDYTQTPWLEDSSEETGVPGMLKRYQNIQLNSNTYNVRALAIHAAIRDEPSLQESAEKVKQLLVGTEAAVSKQNEIRDTLSIVSLAAHLAVKTREPGYEKKLLKWTDWVKKLEFDMKKIPKFLNQLYAEAMAPAAQTAHAQTASASAATDTASTAAASSPTTVSTAATETATKFGRAAKLLKKK